jgi:hypothetical protein
MAAKQKNVDDIVTMATGNKPKQLISRDKNSQGYTT